MDNLKVQVKNEAESKEVQELLEFIGIRAGIKTLTEYIYANFTDREAYNHVMHPDKYKEITIQQLHDLVVLKRNDVGDATHLHIKYKKPKALITSDGLLYFYNFRTDKWDHESKCGDDFSIDNVKPIEKEMKMKEYLNPLKAGGYELSNDALCNDSIEVPEGMNFAIKNRHGIYFFESSGLHHHMDLIWQRSETKNTEQLTGIEATLAERQATYGCFEDVAFVTENIMATLAKARVNGLNELPYPHRMALYMIASKMARIVNGDFNHRDSWHDIGGYAKLVEDLL